MIVIAMGYSGTGSSAIIHLLSEYDGFTDCGLRKYEHLPFYTPHGLFDLEDNLLLNNSLYQSDAAISDFLLAMKRLNDNDFGWFGGYKKRYGDQFMKITNDFVDELVDFREQGYWSYDFEFRISIVELIKDCIKKVLRKNTVEFGKKLFPYGDRKLTYSFCDSEHFYAAAKRFVNRYFKMLCLDESKNILLDQAILPFNLYRIPNYFTASEVKCIVLDRDPRDIFVLNKYIWPKILKAWQVLPTNVEEFTFFYKKYRGIEKIVNGENILRLHFEDLIYNYNETVSLIEQFVGIDSKSHIKPGMHFAPQVSIKNTQNFRMENSWSQEVKYIEEHMKEFIYPFPYEIETRIEDTSDP